ncbi:head GIN domain-containing protein [Pedobacter sp. Hv1]|uniref:head GIN domain-containing protein n=1 Tax=Pedobacter sp. Hv1 TaxID=1740090 RepID=UPI0006D8CDB3|nr:head GIN domain-containing protein [Pedobacter sp. Hv1]KQB99939.1 hypothetical protein AQF98_15630 [Pedobacter sp. Hv1]
MKKLFISLSLSVVLLSLSLEPVLASYPVSVSFSKSKKQERDVKNFNGVAAGGPINVVITLGSTEGLRFEGDADAISTLVVEVKGNILVIRPENSWKSWSRKYDNKKITAYVSAKTIKSLTMSGSGNLSVNGKIKENTLTTTLSGSGSITANADIANYTGVISGSGNLNISGGADDATITISGSGAFTRKGFSVSRLSTVISGSGSVTIVAQDNIDAVISGSGSINYSGDPKVEKRVSGSGRVRKI